MASKKVTLRLQADSAGISRAAALLAQGGLVAVPTETVYGLAARADSVDAVAGIYEAKGRPSFNPLIVHVSDVDQAEQLADFDARAHWLADRFWPGPLTMVLPLRVDAVLAGAVTAGLPTLALRSPAHPAMRALLGQCDFPLAAPSANRSGWVSPTSADHVLATLDGRIDAVLDGGETERGLESTIVALRPNDGWTLLRPGPVTEAELAEILGEGPLPVGEGVEAPGQLAQHYAPGKPVRLNAQHAETDEYLIGFADVVGDCSLSQSGDLAEAAARLYACLYAGAQSALPKIAVATIPDVGIGYAINDRLRRAAA